MERGVMRRQIVNVSVHQTSKVISILYFIITIFFIIPFSVFFYLTSEDPSYFGFLVMPFIYLILSYLITAIFCWLYNVVARGFGGIEFELYDPYAAEVEQVKNEQEPEVVNQNT
jgi:hypothetical protein